MGHLPGLEVVRSKIHGYGLVARRKFVAGEVVCYGDGVIWQQGQDFDDTYCLLLSGYVQQPDGTFTDSGPDVFFDLADQTRWINHSCEPNVDIDSRWDVERQTIVVWWVATRDIEVGEELAYDYAFAAEAAEPCMCGVGSCRGVIVDDDPAELARLPAALRARLRRPVPGQVTTASAPQAEL
jgi:SET domain-containing protein